VHQRASVACTGSLTWELGLGGDAAPVGWCARGSAVGALLGALSSWPLQRRGPGVLLPMLWSAPGALPERSQSDPGAKNGREIRIGRLCIHFCSPLQLALVRAPSACSRAASALRLHGGARPPRNAPGARAAAPRRDSARRRQREHSAHQAHGVHEQPQAPSRGGGDQDPGRHPRWQQWPAPHPFHQESTCAPSHTRARCE
jgi:hypothetical protein